MTNPIESNLAHLGSIEVVLDRGRGQNGLFWDLRRITSAALRKAILRRRIQPILESRRYRDAMSRAARRLREVHREIISAAMSQALREINVQIGDLDFSDLEDQILRDNSRAFLDRMDLAHRKNFSRLVKNASRRYRKNPSEKLLSQLVKDMRPHLALTSRMSSRIQKRIIKLRRAGGLSETNLSIFARSRQRQALSQRAKASASWQLVELVNVSRDAVRRFALSRGLVLDLWKRWRDQRDGNERKSHRDQSEVGWIPYGDEYAIQGVMRPPSRDPGCRCYDEVRHSPP